MKILRNIFGSAGSKTEVSTKVSTKHEREYGHKYSHQHEDHSPAIEYQCPMKCEGDKVYEAPGNCPVCNMKLAAVDSNKNTHGHSHGCC